MFQTLWRAVCKLWELIRAVVDIFMVKMTLLQFIILLLAYTAFTTHTKLGLNPFQWVGMGWSYACNVVSNVRFLA